MYENLGGLGNFGDRNLISNEINNIWAVFGADLDNDGDIDVLTATPGNNQIAWHENLNGLGDFGTEQVITTNAISARHVIAADLDNDGDMGVISASQNDSKIAWYENLHSLGVFENKLASIKLVPNPANDILNLLNTTQLKIKFKILTALGKQIVATSNYEGDIDISSLTSGIYFVEIKSNEASVVKKLVKL